MAHGVRDISPSGLIPADGRAVVPGDSGYADSAEKWGNRCWLQTIHCGGGAGNSFRGMMASGWRSFYRKRRRSDKESLLGNLVDKKTLVNFLENSKNGLNEDWHKDPKEPPEKGKNESIKEKGQALIEYALMLPFIFLLIVNLVNFGGLFFAWITVANAARAGADYAVLGGASVGYGLFQVQLVPTINDVVIKEISSLPMPEVRS